MTDQNKPTPVALPAHLQAHLRQPPAEPPQYHKLYVEVVDNIGEAALTNAEKEVSDPRFTVSHKQQRIKEITQAALPELNAMAEKQLAELEGIRARLTLTAQPTVTPSESQIAQLTYTRDALQVRWPGMTLNEMYQDWQVALDTSDLVKARVYRDFAANALRAKYANISGVANAPLGDAYKTLVQKTDDALSTPEQRKAKADLPVIEETILRVKMARARNEARLQGAQLGRDGKLIDGDEAVRLANLRARF